MSDTKDLNFKMTVPNEAFDELSKLDMLVTPGSREEIEATRHAFHVLDQKMKGGNVSDEKAAEAAAYLISFFNRAIHVPCPAKERMQ